MTVYGIAPTSDEVEVAIFGPGYGEAIAIHLGEGRWFLVDSCLNPATKQPATAEYLDSFGVCATQVKGIVASHWHDDHVKGLSSLVKKYPAAEFFLSGVFNAKESLSFLAAYSGQLSSGVNGGASELFSVISSLNHYQMLVDRKTVFDDQINGHSVVITALSPLSSMLGQAYAHFAQYLAKKDGSINNAPPAVQPNLEAVVLHVDLGYDAILLGADLEDHLTGGWSAVVNDSWVQKRRRSSIYKVAHHGSVTGHHDDIWSRLLSAKPVACMTPFNKGRVHLPTVADVVRIKQLASATYLSSPAAKKSTLNRQQLSRLQSVCRSVSALNSGFGLIRMRKKVTEADWRVECFGDAKLV